MNQICVLISGLSGKMGIEIANACVRRGVRVANIALTGSTKSQPYVLDNNGVKQEIEMFGVGDQAAEKIQKLKEECKSNGDTLIVIDFTIPSAMNPNAEFFCKLGLPFVMGTTGGNQEKIIQDVKTAGIYALIAPNMCKQIVAFQVMMDSMAKEYPGAFGGYKLQVQESHQSTKADTSGTAKAVIQYLNALKGGETFTVEDIVKVRDPAKQLAMGVPQEALTGHAWHTYTLTSGDGSVLFEFKHNVCGRRTYAEGVVDAVIFLQQKITTKSAEKIYNMIDVLRAGGMMNA